MEDSMKKIVQDGYENGDYANAFRKNTEPNELEKNYLVKLIKLLPKKSRVLDFGCGIGIPFDSYLVNSGIDVTGIDISTKHLKQAKKNVPQATFIKGDFSVYEFQEKFDAIVSFYAIFHIPRDEHKKLFEKMFDLLKVDGVILITLGASDYEYMVNENWFGSPKMAWSSHKPDNYKKLIVDAGFKLLDLGFEGKFGDEEYHFWLLAQKIGI
jgi:cyclopropane fatty-acyl-phospholipid synthase-like methyltransferase